MPCMSIKYIDIGLMAMVCCPCTANSLYKDTYEICIHLTIQIKAQNNHLRISMPNGFDACLPPQVPENCLKWRLSNKNWTIICAVHGHFEFWSLDQSVWWESIEQSIASKNQTKYKEAIVQHPSAQAHWGAHDNEMEDGRQHKREQSTHCTPNKGYIWPKCRNEWCHNSQDSHHDDTARVQA